MLKCSLARSLAWLASARPSAARAHLEVIVDGDDAALGDGRVAAHDLLHLAGAQAVRADVDHVVGAAADGHVPVLVDEAAVAGEVVTREAGQVSGNKPGHQGDRLQHLAVESSTQANANPTGPYFARWRA